MKSEIRKRILQERDALPITTIAQFSKAISEKLFSSKIFREAKVVMFYVSFRSEVSTMDMILNALAQGKRVCVPMIKQNALFASEIRALKELNKTNKFGIMEPDVLREVRKEDIDMVIVPCAAFDRLHRRLGYGLGYYDAFLSGMRAKKVGIAFSLQEADGIPTNEWDVSLDAIVTEKGVV